MNNCPKRLKPISLLSMTLAICSPWAAAQRPVVPDSGVILQQVKPAAPAKPSGEAELKIEQTDAAKLPSSAPFQVTIIRITGNEKIDSQTLHALIADAEGKQLTLAELGELATRITHYYRSHGYPLARAFIPAQTIEAGAVTIEISEARYGNVTLDNSSRTSDHLLQSMVAPLRSGDVIVGADLDHTLLLLADVPGVVSTATLKPGAAVGTSDLQVAAAPSPALSGNVVLDNYGNRYTGRTQLGATVNANNPLHYGDVVSLSGVSSASGMNYGRLAYEALLNGYGTRAGGYYSALDYELGAPLNDLDANGTARVGSLWIKHPLVRSRDINLYGQIQYDRLQLRDHIDASAIHNDRGQENWTLSLAGDARDSFLSDAVNAWSLGWTKGRVGFNDAMAKSTDAGSADTQGSFSKWNATVSRLQSIGTENSLYLTLGGQWANTNLDSAQKMSVGGPYSVRAYDVGVISGDTGYGGSVEFRHEIGQAWQGRWQALAFFDSAHVTINKNTWATGSNSATLSGAGLGLNWTGIKLGSIRAYIAAPIGSTPVQIGSTNSARAWVESSVAF